MSRDIWIYTPKQKKGQHMNIVKVRIIIIANRNLDVHNTPYQEKNKKKRENTTKKRKSKQHRQKKKNVNVLEKTKNETGV